MGKIRLRDYRVGAALLTVALALILFAPHEWAIIVLVILVVILLLVGLLSNVDRWRHQEMDPAHAQLIQAIANSLDRSVTSSNGTPDYSDGTSDRPINRALFRGDYPELVAQIDLWEATFSVLPRQVQRAQKEFRDSAQSTWPTLHPLTLGEYAFEYTKTNLMSSGPGAPWIALMPEDRPSQLLQMMSTSAGKVLYDYGSTLRGENLVEAQHQCDAVKRWVAAMFNSPEAAAWRATFLAQNELRVRISGKLQKIGVQTTLPRGKCQVCTGKK